MHSGITSDSAYFLSKDSFGHTKSPLNRLYVFCVKPLGLYEALSNNLNNNNNIY